MNTNSNRLNRTVRPSIALGLIIAGLLGATAGSASAHGDENAPSNAQHMTARAQGSDRHLQMLNDEIAERQTSPIWFNCNPARPARMIYACPA